MPSYKNKHMKNTFMTLVYSKVLQTGRHPLGEDVISPRGLYSLALFSPSITCNINTLQIKVSSKHLEPSLFYSPLFYQIMSWILQDITGLKFLWDHKYDRLL